MPQLDFTWWMMKFFLIWVTISMVLTVLLAKTTPSKMDQLSSLPEIKKETTEWQWL